MGHGGRLIPLLTIAHHCPPRPGMHWNGGRYLPPPSPPIQGAQPMPSHRLCDAKCQPQLHL